MGRTLPVVAFVLLSVLAACGNTDVTCDATETLCAGVCVDTALSHDHCGACDTPCALGEVCFDGVCSADCGGGTTKCGDTCFDTNVDPQNCGACGVVCPTNLACNHAVCTSTCDTDQQVCVDKAGAHCISVLTDNANCGACGTSCGVEQVCSEGKCGSSCDSTQTLCTPNNQHPYCASTQTDNANCGACGNVCDSTLGCVGGACAPICKATDVACFPKNATPYCADVNNDPENCGGCASSCGTNTYCEFATCRCVVANETWCSGACTDATTDTANCGACGSVCAGVCSLSRCEQVINTEFEIAEILADDTGVFIAAGYVWFISNSGGAPTNITAGYLATDIEQIALDAKNVYFVDNANDGQRIGMVPKGGGTTTILTTLSVDDANFVNLTTDSTNVYVRAPDGIYSVSIASSSNTLLADGDGEGYRSPAIATDGTSVFWLTTNSILRVPVGGGTVTTIANIEADSLFTNNSILYFLAGGAIQELEGVGTPHVVALASSLAVADVIYGSNGLTAFSYDPKTLAQQQIVDNCNPWSSWLFTANTSYLFWSSSGTVYIVPH